jgi:hypothetical protein
MNDGMPRFGVGMEPPVPRKMILSIADVYAFQEYDVYPVLGIACTGLCFRTQAKKQRYKGEDIG